MITTQSGNGTVRRSNLARQQGLGTEGSKNLIKDNENDTDDDDNDRQWW